MDDQIKDKLKDFFTQFKRQTYKKGETIIHAGDNPSSVFFIEKGNVKKYAISEKGEEVVLNSFKPNSFFPMSLAVNDSPNEYYYDAVTEVEVWKAPSNDVVAFVKSQPDVLYDLLRRVYRGTDGLETRILFLMAGNAYTRLISELLIQAQRFGERRGDTYILTLTEKDLAAQTGTTRETVSRELKVLKEKELVEFYKNMLTIKSFSKLQLELRMK